MIGSALLSSHTVRERLETPKVQAGALRICRETTRSCCAQLTIDWSRVENERVVVLLVSVGKREREAVY